MTIQVGGTTVLDSSGNLRNIDGSPGSTPYYFCRAWVNFNGTGAVSIRVGAGISSITDRGTGRYTVNLPSQVDANYATVGACRRGDGARDAIFNLDTTSDSYSQIAVGVGCTDGSNGVRLDPTYCCVAIFR